MTDYGLPTNRPLGGLQGQPKNTNLAIPQNFLFRISRCPDLSYFIQEVQLPERGGSESKQFSYMIGPSLKQPSSGAGYADFTISFLIDETLSNYYNLVTWMREGQPYKNFENIKPLKDVYDEAYMIFLTNKKVPYRKITFRGIIPIELSGLEFTHSDTEFRPLTATCKFAVTEYVIDNL